MIARLLLTVVLSGLIGLERQVHRRNAGLRTHILVALGSCL
ncbi:MAG: MgtC/SapB family protein, partial [Candidatus Omnitrophota bacterium]